MRNIIPSLLLMSVMFTPAAPAAYPGNTPAVPRLGVWITVFNPEKVLFSRESADRFLRTCVKAGVDDIYLQVYRADKAYYDSDITDPSPYLAAREAAGADLIEYILEKAHGEGMLVHAWLNALSVSQNTKAGIFDKSGNAVLTLDQHGRTSMARGNRDELDKYYIRENQLFLEPGDRRVKDHITKIAREVIRKYPGFDGIHLDYIRYPAAVPFIPGSRFTSHGLSYGYGKANVKGFLEKTGIDPRKFSGKREDYSAWNSWRRDMVTGVVISVSEAVRAAKPGTLISCTIVPSVERTSLVTFQDWERWLTEDIVDYVTVMNYTDDPGLFMSRARSMLIPPFIGRVYIGVGAHLMKGEKSMIEQQVSAVKALSPGGIVIFSYDELAEDSDLTEYLGGV